MEQELYKAEFSEKKDEKLADIKTNCNSVDGIVKSLKECGEHHRTYRIYYRELGIVENIFEKKALFARNDYEDKVDSKNIQDTSDGFIKFILCFTYSISENVAMWKIYRNDNHESLCVKYSKDVLRKIVEANKCKIKVGIWNKNKDDRFEAVKDVDGKNYSIEVADVLYYDKKKLNKGTEKKEYYIKRADSSAYIEKDLFDNLPKHLTKHNSWCFENETRLIVSIKKDLIADENITAVKIVIPDDVIKSLTSGEKIIQSPFYEKELTHTGWKIEKSVLYGKVELPKLTDK